MSVCLYDNCNLISNDNCLVIFSDRVELIKNLWASIIFE